MNTLKKLAAIGAFTLTTDNMAVTLEVGGFHCSIDLSANKITIDQAIEQLTERLYNVVQVGAYNATKSFGTMTRSAEIGVGDILHVRGWMSLAQVTGIETFRSPGNDHISCQFTLRGDDGTHGAIDTQRSDEKLCRIWRAAPLPKTHQVQAQDLSGGDIIMIGHLGELRRVIKLTPADNYVQIDLATPLGGSDQIRILYNAWVDVLMPAPPKPPAPEYNGKVVNMEAEFLRPGDVVLLTDSDRVGNSFVCVISNQPLKPKLNLPTDYQLIFQRQDGNTDTRWMPADNRVTLVYRPPKED